MKSPPDDIDLHAPESSPVRLDVFLARHLPNGSRQQARRLIDQGLVRVNGHRARKGDAVHPHDHIRVTVPRDEPAALAPDAELTLPVLYEDDAVVVVDKPAGMPTQALRLTDHGTVANFLIARYPEMGEVSDTPGDAGVVHRLDNGTSGALLAARTAEAHSALRRQFREHRVAKEYLALVAGRIAEAGVVDTPIAHQPRHRRRMCACPDTPRAHAYKARPALTRYRPVEPFAAATLVAISIETGVRHQIRVHLASIGHPVLGDTMYGANTNVVGPGITRCMLHASRLRFRHPVSGRLVTVDAPLPADFLAALEGLRSVPPRQRIR